MIIPASDIQFVENHAPLGHGKFGSVQIARYRERELVAVKSLKCEGGTSDPLDSLSLFINEAKLMKLLNHRRIVAFMGFSVELLAIILEFSPFGPLSSFISASKLLESRDWPQIQQLAADIAEGMRFLHSDFYPSTSERKVQFFHQDLKPSNVLLFPEESDPTSPSRLLRAKITDFGISVKRKGQLKTASSTMTFTAHAGSIVLQAKNNSIYQAPELASTENFTKRCDVVRRGLKIVFHVVNSKSVLKSFHMVLLFLK